MKEFLKGTVGKEYAHRIPVMMDMMEKEGNVLDLGDRNSNPVPKALRAAGLEVVTMDVEDADINVNLEEAKLPFEDKEFSCVFAGDVFEHVYNLKGLLKEVHRVLKDDGYLILSTPNLVSIIDRIKVVLGKLPTSTALGDYFGPHEHVRDWNWKMLREYLHKSGFRIVEEKTEGVAFRGKLIASMCPKNLGCSIIVKAIKL